MNLNDPDDPEARQLTRYQYNAMVLQERYGSFTHDSICIEVPAPPTTEVLVQLEEIMNAPCVPAAPDVYFAVDARICDKPFEPLSVEVVERLKAIGALF